MQQINFFFFVKAFPARPEAVVNKYLERVSLLPGFANAVNLDINI